MTRSASRAVLLRRLLMAGASVAVLALASPQALAAGNSIRLGGNGSSASVGIAPVTATANAVTSAAAQAAMTAIQSANSLQRATAILSQFQAAQSAARNLVVTPTTPVANGLNVPNGLVPVANPNSTTDGTTTWTGASAPTQSVSNGQYNVTVNQTQTTAILSWKSFNVGPNTTLTFNQQGNTNWIALNQVTDPTASPTQILGTINATGQVYIINANGIIFGAQAQVDVGTLLASALPINMSLVNAGTLYSNLDAQFTFSAYAQPGGSYGPTSPFTPPPATTASQTSEVVVQAGAQIIATDNAGNNGGRVVLVGPIVTNNGSITTDDGQTILAAGQEAAFLPHSSSDPSLRGLDTYIGSVLAPAIGSDSTASTVSTGTVTNNGIIEADRGDITMAGASVVQNGALISTTSVSLDGRIDLEAQYNAAGVSTNPGTGTITVGFTPLATGSVSVNAGSVIEVSPELEDTETITGALALPSQVNILGDAIYIDSLIAAPGGQVSINAGNYSQFNNTTGQVYLDSAADIDVSGSIGVPASVSQNIIAVQLLGAQLADSPLQRSGALAGQTVYVDINETGTNADGTTWVGTPLADVSGYVDLIQHTVGELTTSGGSISLIAGQSVVQQSGSLLNVSGGWTNYAGALVDTTNVISSGGQIYNISQANPDLVYTGIANGYTVTHTTWGIQQQYTSVLGGGSETYQAGYVQGGNGGTISIQAPDAALDGSLLGLTVAGPRQQNIVPTPSSFSLAFFGNTSNNSPIIPATTPDVAIETGSGASAAPFSASNLSLDPTVPVDLSPDLLGTDGFGDLTIDSPNGAITIASTIVGQPGGALTLTAASIDVRANVTIPDGTISLTALPVATESSQSLSGPQAGHGILTVESGVALDTSGLIVDDVADPSAMQPYLINGGTISLTGYFLDVESGSTLNVSSGVTVNSNGKTTNGNAGSIAIVGGQGTDATIDPSNQGLFVLDAALEGYATGKGGSLSITAPAIQIGGDSAPANVWIVQPGFFNQGGFASVSLTGVGLFTAQNNNFVPGMVVSPGATIDPQIESYAVVQSSTGASLTPTLMPSVLRSPASLALNASGFQFQGAQIIQGDFVMDAGSAIELDPTASGTGTFSSSANTITNLGAISVPGGTISLKASETLDLAPGSLLSAAGAYIPTIDSYGNVVGEVLSGGSISVSGNILAEPGAVLDVSGASGAVETLTGTDPFGGPEYTQTQYASDGGSITLAGISWLYSAATLRGFAGGPSALGGNLSVSSGAFLNTTAPNLIVTQNVPSGVTYPTGLGLINGEVGYQGSPLALGLFTANDFAAGGFGALTLGGLVQFSGPVALSASLSITVASGGILTADNTVSLSAPYVAIGELDAPPGPAPQPIVAPIVTVNGANGPVPTVVSSSFGTGSLSVNASDLLDIGSIALQTIGTASLSATNDIRGDGTLEATGSLSLTAGQIYPITDTVFTIAAFDNGTTLGSITIASSGVQRDLPLSAGGTLNVFASQIVQDGVLRAPIGTINLGSTTAPTATNQTGATVVQTFDTTQTISLGQGSITSVSAVDPVTGDALTIPYGTELTDTNWIDPSGTDITAGGVPAKTINIAGASVSIGTGATIDLSGGGDLYAYNFVAGLGGTTDILASSASYAIIPGYQADFAPVVQITSQNTSGGTQVEAGWSNSNLAVGDVITLAASTNGLPAGTYTLLPARYALLPGAFLVTPTSGNPLTSAVANPDGSSIVPGYAFNDLDTARTLAPLPALFEVDSSTVVNSLAEYDSYLANATLAAGATAAGNAVPRLPIDAGQLTLTATTAMSIESSATMTAPKGGLGGIVDIGSPNPIVINDTGTGPESGTLYLNATSLSDFGAQSLLIGGTRSFDTSDAQGTANVTVTPSTDSLTLANDSAAPLTGPDIILVSTESLAIDAGAVIEAEGTLSNPAGTLALGNANVAGSGDGALVRVSSDPTAAITRDPASITIGGGLADLSVGAKAQILGGNGAAILDSTNLGSFDPTATLTGASIALGSGQISIQLNNPGALQPDAGLVLPSSLLGTLQNLGGSLSLTSYSSIDLYGTGTIGNDDVTSLTLHAAGIRGFNQGSGAVTFIAQSVSIDNSPNGQAVTAVSGVDDTPSGSLTFDAGTLTIGNNNFAVVGYQNLALNASGGVVVEGTGAFSTAGNLAIATPQITTATLPSQAGSSTATATSQAITAGGDLTITNPGGTSTVSSLAGLGASLTLTANSITNSSDVWLPSGTLSLAAIGTGADSGITIANGGTLDVSGVGVAYFDQMQYSGGGTLSLASGNGAVTLASGSVLNVAAPSAAGNAGSLSISAPNGVFSSAATLNGQAGTGGQGGTFVLYAGSIPLDANGNQSLGALDAALDAGGFDLSRNIRLHNGDVLINGTETANSLTVSADSGQITVTGTLDASGVTGGAIALYAHNGITLSDGALLTVAAQQLDDAGEGGSVDLESGEAESVGGNMTSGVGWINIAAGSIIDLSVAGGIGGTLHLRAPQISGVDASGNPIPILANATTAGGDLAIKPLQGTILDPSSIVIEGFAIFDLTADNGVIDSAVENAVNVNGQQFTANTGAVGVAGSIANRLLAGTPNVNLAAVTHVDPGEEIVTLTALNLSLNSKGSSISVPAGSGVTFPTGTPSGDLVSFSAAGSIISAAGITTPFAANTPISVPAGSTVALDTIGTFTLASGSAAISFTLKGGGSSSTTGSTTVTAGSGTGLTLAAGGSSIALPANAAITFTDGLPTGDTLVLGGSTKFDAPAAGSVVTLTAPGTSVVLGAATSVTLPTGDSFTSTSAFTTVASGADLSLANGNTIRLAANASLPFSIPSGDTITNGSSGITAAVITAPTAGSTVTLNSAIFSTIKLSNNTTSLEFPKGTPGTDEIRTSVAATIIESNGQTIPLAANATTAMPAGSTLTLTGSTIGGTVTYASGNTVLPITLSIGSFILSTNTAITALSQGSTLGGGTGGGTLNISAVAGQPITTTLPAGTYNTSGTISNLPTGTTFSAGTLTLASGPAAVPIVLPDGDFTVGSGVTVNGLATGTTASATAADTVTFASGGTAIPLSLASGSYALQGDSTFNLSSDLTLPSDWNLDSYRYGPNATAILGSGEPGILELRSPGNLIFDGSLSDGFGLDPIDPSTNAPALWEAPLLAPGSQSWSYRLVAGADFSAADFHQVLPSSGTSGNIELGIPSTGVTTSASAATSTAVNGYYQVIRTGTGSIDIAASRDVELLNQFATIYTAGSQVATSQTATVTPGGSVSILANTPVTFPNGTPAGDTVVLSASGVETLPVILTNAISTSPILPVGAVLTFPSGFTASTTAGIENGLTSGTSQIRITTTTSGAILQLNDLSNAPANGLTSITLVPGDTVSPAPNTSGTLIASAPGTISAANGNVVSSFSAGAVINFSSTSPSFANGNTLTLTGGGVLSVPSTVVYAQSTNRATVILSAGQFSTTTAQSANVQIESLPSGSSLALAGNGTQQISTSTPVSIEVSLAIAANTDTSLMAGASLTLSGNGAVTLDHGTTNLSALLPIQSGNNIYDFDLPNTSYASNTDLGASPAPAYIPQYATGGGNVTITAGLDIIHLGVDGAADSSQQLPTDWLYRRDDIVNGQFAPTNNLDIGSTTWWVDYSNFFEGVGALGGGNVTLKAGRDVMNVDAVIPTDAWSPYQTTTVTASEVTTDTLAADQPLFQYGGGDLIVQAGRDINGGVYYVEQGNGTLIAGGEITTNETRTTTLASDPLTGSPSDPTTWLPTTLFLGVGSLDISANSNVLIGSVSNPFLLPQGENNGYWDRTYFSTYAPSDTVTVSSLTGDVTIKGNTSTAGSLGSGTLGPGTLAAWITDILAEGDLSGVGDEPTVSQKRPWLRLTEAGGSGNDVGIVFSPLIGLMPPALTVTSFTGDIDLIGDLTLAPAPNGTVSLFSAGSINALQAYATGTYDGIPVSEYTATSINLSDADPDSIPGLASPIVGDDPLSGSPIGQTFSLTEPYDELFSTLFQQLTTTLTETGSTTTSTKTQDTLHAPGLLHANDPNPVYIYAKGGSITDLELFAGKPADVIAANDISDVAFYLQNNNANQISVIAAGQDILLSDPTNPEREAVITAAAATTHQSATSLSYLLPPAWAGDVSVGGSGTVEVLAGRDLDLGPGAENADGTGVGIVTIGNERNPYLPFDQGATIISAAGLGPQLATGLSGSNANFSAFVAAFPNPATAGALATTYLPDLGSLMGLGSDSNDQVWSAFEALPANQQDALALDIFYLVLRDTGRNHNNPDSPGFGLYTMGFDAIADLFPGNTWQGDISLTSRELETAQGGDIDVLTPGGQVLVGYNLGNSQPLDQGILTLENGNINIYAENDVTVGTSRIFTFKGGNIVIWSSEGNIDAGASSKTLQEAPPARFEINPETGASIEDIAGLATGGGIGTLQTVPGAPPGDVDLIAPNGIVNAGQAGIRASGNFNVAALAVLNSFNITVQGTSTGIPVVAVPNIAALSSAANVAGSSAVASMPPVNGGGGGPADLPSVIIVEVVGYGGSTSDDENQQNGKNQ